MSDPAPAIEWPQDKYAPLPDWDKWDDILTIGQCAKLTRTSAKFIRQQIRNKALHAFIPGGRDPRRTGPGVGYRVIKGDLQRWYFGTRAF
jgi:hypothetical protein